MSTDLFGNPDPPIHSSAATGSGSLGEADNPQAPLAVRMRPRSLDELVGQARLVEEGSPLRRLVEGQAMSVFLWGPPGSGKTTIAHIVAQAAASRFVELSAVAAGVRQVRAELDAARHELARGRPTVLFIDEVHRFSKSQQDVLLPAVENRIVTLIAATTENPSFSVVTPLLSRSLVVRLEPLSDADLAALLERAMTDERGLRAAGVEPPELTEEARRTICALAGGDARRALTLLEASASTATARGALIDREAVASAAASAVVAYDPSGDEHYNVVSAFIKSVRGSDVDAALHYLARMLAGGEDPRFIARRLIVLASEDVGLAAPSVLQTAVAAAQAVALIGMPEARLNLAHATIAAATAPKSNRVMTALDAACADVAQGLGRVVPPHLRDSHFPGAREQGVLGYVYPHDHPHSVVRQQYLPSDLGDRVYYEPSGNGQEAVIAERLASLRAITREPGSHGVH